MSVFLSKRRHLRVEAGLWGKKMPCLVLQEILLAKTQRSGEVSVEVDTTDSVDLLKTLEEMREQYESVVLKNRLEVEKWYTAQVSDFRMAQNNCEENVHIWHCYRPYWKCHACVYVGVFLQKDGDPPETTQYGYNRGEDV